MADGSQPAPVVKALWTSGECDVIRRHYPCGGVAACAPLLPGRTARSITEKALNMGVRWRFKGPRAAIIHYADHDAAIVAFYQSKPKPGDLRRLAKKLDRPTWYLSRRALEIGARQPSLRQPDWSPREIEMVEDHGHYALARLRRLLKRAGYDRTETAIEMLRRRLRLSVDDARIAAGMFSATQVSIGFGVAPATVARWIRMGLLVAERRESSRDDDVRQFDVLAKDIRQFVKNNRECIDLRRVDRDWFLNILFDP